MSPPVKHAKTQDAPEKPYGPLRRHTKSRNGCLNCKARKVKCDEARPACRGCTLRSAKCQYVCAAASDSPDHQAAPTVSLHTAPKPPLLPAGEEDSTEMKLFWFYTTTTVQSFLSAWKSRDKVEQILKTEIPRQAFGCRFLMDTLLGLSALQLQHFDHSIKPSRALHHRVQAFHGYQRAIEAAKPETFPALVACSLLLIGLASPIFQEFNEDDLRIPDWMVVWSGIGIMVDFITPATLRHSDVADLFLRPHFDRDITGLHVPCRLLFLVSSMPSDDPEQPHISTYKQVLEYLGSLYAELRDVGFGPCLTPRILSWFTLLPRSFISLATARQPLALVILAHYLMFTKLAHSIWWIEGIADREIPAIARFLGPKWEPELAVPLATGGSHDPVELARLVLGDPTWVPPARDLEHEVDEKVA